jgi:hypothetical protein
MDHIKALLESSKYTPLSTSEAAAMKMMLENTEKEHSRLISEGTLSGDVAQFTPILMPIVRRVYPNLIANELLGVQPMSMPTGFIYALTNQYTGDSVSGSNSNLMIIRTSDDASGIALYSEGNLHLVPKDADLTGLTVSATYSNEAAFSRIFKNYTGPHLTGAAEQLAQNMKEVGFSISKKSVEAKSRALKGQYTVEMYQDLKAQHGLLADEEIMSLMSYEMQAEIDRECVDFINANAAQLPDTVISPAGQTAGRWEIEKYRAHSIRIAKEAAQIGVDTKRGQGNILLVSPKVATMLQQVGTFKTAEQTSNVFVPVSGGVAGTFDGRFKVVVDQYAASDYVTVLYKGADRRDAMGFFAPYIPMSFTKVTNVDSGQPAVIAKTRYALDTIPGISSPVSGDRAATYARSFGVDFTDTILA